MTSTVTMSIVSKSSSTLETKKPSKMAASLEEILGKLLVPDNTAIQQVM